jgi:4-aminobutyrate aminotransferase
MWACEHSGVKPDIMTSAKGLGSGMPIGAIIAKKTIMEQWKRGAHGNTYGGNPLSCAAAIATLDLVQSEYAANAALVGEHFMGRLREMMRDYPCIGEVRGRGLMIGMELIENDAERTPARGLCDRLVTRGYYNGLLLLSCGVSTLRFMPPLSTTIAEVDEAVGLLRTALDEALQGKGA